MNKAILMLPYWTETNNQLTIIVCYLNSAHSIFTC